MIYEHEGKRPTIDPSSRIAPNAVVCGDVTIGPNCSIGFGAVLTAETGPITVGENCVIMDTAVVRGVRRDPVRIGKNVLVGPHAYLTGCEVADNVFIATGAAVFNGARIGERAWVLINGIVMLRTVLPPGAVVPLNWIALGNPAEILPPNEDARISAILQQLNFPNYVFGVADRAAVPDVMNRYAARLRRHNDDKTA